MSKQVSKPDMADTQHSQHNLEEINQIMTHQILDLLKDKLTELKGDTNLMIFQNVSSVNHYCGTGFRYKSYERIVKSIITFFREYCTSEWYPNNAVKEKDQTGLDVSGYCGAGGESKLMTELMDVFALMTGVYNTMAAKHRALKSHTYGPDGDCDLDCNLERFGYNTFRKWMIKMQTPKAKHDGDDVPNNAKKAILSFIKDMRDEIANPKNKDEEEYKCGRVRAMCFALLLMEELTKAGGLEQDRSYIKILGAAMIHALTTHANDSGPLWEHICDVIYPPGQHKEETILFDYVAACTMGSPYFNFSVGCGFLQSTCSCSSNCVCDQEYVFAEDALGFFLNNDIIESVRKWPEKLGKLEIDPNKSAERPQV